MDQSVKFKMLLFPSYIGNWIHIGLKKKKECWTVDHHIAVTKIHQSATTLTQKHKNPHSWRSSTTSIALAHPDHVGSPAGQCVIPHHKTQNTLRNVTNSLRLPAGLKVPQIQIWFNYHGWKSSDPWSAVVVRGFLFVCLGLWFMKAGTLNIVL